MNEILNALYGNLHFTDELKAFIITFLFIFIISITVDMIGMIKGTVK